MGFAGSLWAESKLTRAVSGSASVGKSGAEKIAIRQRVLDNLGESAIAREKSQFSVFIHKSNALEIELEARLSPINNTKVRNWYNESVAIIPKMNEQWIRHGVSLEDRALLAYNIRHDARLQARKLMSKPAEVEMLQARDLIKYKNPNGPSFEQLYKKYEAIGYRNEQIYQSIIDNAKVTNPEYNAKFTPR